MTPRPFALLLLSLAPACAVRAGSPAAASALAQLEHPTSPPLDRSLFPRDPAGALDEDSLQKILDAPIAIDLPGRVGVLPIATDVDGRGPSPTYRVPTGAVAFTHALATGGPFTMVTEMLAIPSGSLGMEALRTIAARYRLRYLLLYREELGRRSRNNGWAAGYATILGAFVLPGQTLSAFGFIEATLLDVKTGTLMFTVRKLGSVEKSSNVWHNDNKLDEMEAGLVSGLAPGLASAAIVETGRYAEAVRGEARRVANR